MYQNRIERLTVWLLNHWLLCANSAVLLYGGLPWLSPLARAAGYSLIGQAIFLAYGPLCHQLPERSFMLAGYQVAFCHRDAAIYTVLLLAGLLFVPVRRRLPPAPLWLGGLLLLPILIDGGSHALDDFFGAALRNDGNTVGTLNFWLRMLTGALCAIGIVLTAYPRLERDLRPMAAH